MNNITKSKFDSNVVKFQTKIRKNFQLYCFLEDAIFRFAKLYKSEFKDYKFLNFLDKFKNVSVKKTSEIKKIKYTEILDYGKNLIESELSNLVFVLNMSDFEAWLVESLNLIFSSDRKMLITGKINENFLCRNLIVHNKNKVNKEYLDKAEEYAKFEIGEVVKISKDYLFEQGDNFFLSA